MPLAASFGSFGDIISLSIVIKDLIKALDDSRGSTAEFQEINRELWALDRVLLEVELLWRTCENTIELNALRETARRMTDQCRRSIEWFLEKIKEYGPSLRHNGPGNIIRDTTKKIKWQIVCAGQLTKFRAEINAHCSAISMLLVTASVNLTKLNDKRLHIRLADNNAKVEASSEEQHSLLEEVKSKLDDTNDNIRAGNEIATRISEALRLDWIRQLGQELKGFMRRIILMNVMTYKAVIEIRGRLPSHLERSLYQEPFILEDGIGRIAPVHMQFIDCWEAFDSVLELRFRNMQGYRMVQNKEYVIQESSTRREIDRSLPWQASFLPGQKVVMSMIFNDTIHSTSSCPRCQTSSEEPQSSEIQCAGCGMWYRRITEFKDVDPPQSMNQSQIRKLRDAPAVFGQSSFKSIVIGPPAPSEDMSDSRKRKLEHVQDDDITRFKRVRVLSKKTRVRRTKPGPETFIRFATQSEYQQTENNIASVLSNQNVISVSPTRTLARPIILPPLPAHFQSVLPFKPLDAQKNAFGYREVVKQKVLNSDELISNKTWLDVHARAGSMSLTRAAKDGNVSLVSALLRHGADPNPPLANGQTALGLAAEEGHHEVVDILLKNGAFRTTNIPQAEAALLAAAINGKVTVVDLLLESGVCFSIRDFFGRTILHRAAWNGHRRVAELLLLKGANIDAKDTYGQSALHKAAACGEEDVVRLLLVSKADIKIRDFDGYTASDRAIANGFDAIAEALNTFIAEG